MVITTQTCEYCDKEFTANRDRTQPKPRFCGLKCYNEERHGKVHEWTDYRGYRIIGFNRHCDGKKAHIGKHRAIMIQHLKRPLSRQELVHHINGDKNDNRLENLELTTMKDHCNHHRSADWYEDRPFRARDSLGRFT